MTGGIPCQLRDAGDYQVERVFIAGYQDGSVRIWDATYPSFSPILYLEPEVCISCYVLSKFQLYYILQMALSFMLGYEQTHEFHQYSTFEYGMFHVQVIGLNISGLSASISALDFCSVTLNVAVGNECGLVMLFILLSLFF